MEFSSDQNGFVTAVKFYAGQGNTGPQPVAIWSTNGTQLGEGMATGGADGWRTVALNSPVPITAGISYIASYTAPAGHYAVTLNGLSAAIDAPPLHVPANAGRYNYPGGFPSNATTVNFWVDVILVVPPAGPDGRTEAARAAATPATEPKEPPAVTPPADAEPDPSAGGTSSAAATTTSTAKTSSAATTSPGSAATPPETQPTILETGAPHD